MRSVVAAVLASAALAAAVHAAPSGPTDRSVKLDLIAKLKHGPEILILGDSRGRQAEPSLLRRLTGHTAFNAAVTGGSAPDAWVFTREAADHFPLERRRYIFFVSSGVTGYIPDPRMQADPRGRKYLAEVASLLSSETVMPNPWQTWTHYHPDGSIAGAQHAPTAAQVAGVRAKAAAAVARIAQSPPGPVTPDPARFRLFEHLIGYMNSQGATPVIVLNPVYPTILAELRKVGDPLTTDSLSYLRGLQSRYRLVVVNCQDSHVWGGHDDDWSNTTHVDLANMRRMLPYIVRHSRGALR